MPGFDGTGPRGLGRMTGRGFGYCAGYSPTNYSPYGYQQPMMPSLPSAYPYQPSYTQYPYQPAQQAGYPAAMPIQQPYYGNLPFGPGPGYGRGLGLGWGRGFGPGSGYGRGLGIGWRRGFF